MNTSEPRKQPEVTRQKLIDATQSLMLRQGFNATTVDEICDEAGVTRGAFFHHFDDKEDIAIASVKAWGEMGRGIYAKAWKQPGEPLDELHRIFDIMENITRQFDPCICLAGMMAQEMSIASDKFRTAVLEEFEPWADMMSSRLRMAQELLKPSQSFDPEQVAWFLYSIWQGSILIAKTRQLPAMIRNNIRLARSYVDSLFADHDESQPITKRGR